MAEQQQQQQPQPQVITLNHQNSIEILANYIEVAQKAGAFALSESDLLKRSRDVLLQGAEDAEINVPVAKNLFIQAITKGQSKGAYTLQDASILFNVCQYVARNMAEENTVAQPVTQEDDLNSLSDPIPLRTSGPKVV